MTMLQSSGEDPSRYYNGEFILDQRRVNIGYNQYKKAGFSKNFRADLGKVKILIKELEIQI